MLFAGCDIPASLRIEGCPSPPAEAGRTTSGSLPAGRAPGRTPRRDSSWSSWESRCMLSTATWTSASGGSWSTAADWSTQAVPQSGDDVVINQPGNIQITLAGSASVHSVSITGDTLVLQGGAALTTTGAVTNSGTITVNASAQITVGGSYSESGGATLSMPGGGPSDNPTSNLLANSDLESPAASNGTTAPSGWAQWGSAYLSTQYAYTGSQSLQASGANSGILQSFAATPGKSYTLSADAMTLAGNPLTGSEEGSLELIFYDSTGTQEISDYTPPNTVMILRPVESNTGGPLSGSVGSQGWSQFSTTALAAVERRHRIVGDSCGRSISNGSGPGGGAVYFDALRIWLACGPQPVEALRRQAAFSSSGAITTSARATRSQGRRHLHANLSTGTRSI